MFELILAMTSGIYKSVCVCVFCRRGSSEFSSALQTIFHLQIEKKKDKSQFNLSQKLCICHFKPFSLYGHHLALF
jgi:hypothetical protein